MKDFAVAARRATVGVELGPRRYDIHIGPQALEELAAGLAPFKLRRLLVVADATVWRLHAARLRAALAPAGLELLDFVVPAGEGSKDFATLQALCDRLLAVRPERGDMILAFGGGVIGDLAGFAAAILLRGIDFVQVPTTLLAQVDSSVGGKTGINTPAGKNLVGAFHQPRLVVADTALLDTLPRRERLAGYAEIAKYGLLGDAAFFDWLEANGAAAVDRAGPERTGAVRHSCAMKAEIVAADEREAGRRALLNLGHTFGHALEAEAGYGEALLHGEAVALGCLMALDLSARLGLGAAGASERLARHWRELGLPVSLKDGALAGRAWPAEALIGHMASDKKAQGGRVAFILARRIGDAFVARDVPMDAVRATLRAAGAS